MICYKDTTFCTLYKDCKEGNKCEDALTPEVKADAEELWSGYDSLDSCPISIYIYLPKCFNKKKAIKGK